jgi:hypothetical protein
MGSYCSLRFDDIEITGAKSVVPDVFISLFQESDRRDVSVEENGETVSRQLYLADRQTILDRLDILGFTSEAARLSFEAWYRGELETWTSYVADGSDWALERLTALRAFTFKQWASRVPEILSKRYTDAADAITDEAGQQMLERDEGWLFFAAPDERLVLRAILDACPQVQKITLDISDLVGGGWLVG